MGKSYDVAVIGAGMAGASIAAELSPHVRVLLLEAEERPGYHATGRSAAFWEECYGGPEIVPLTLASGPYLHKLGMLDTRGALYIGREEDGAQIDSFMERFSNSGVNISRLGRADLEQIVPGIRPDWIHAIHEPACADIDVAGLHQHYLSIARRNGVELRTSARVERMERAGGEWSLTLERGGTASAAMVVNAAGAWADRVAALVGAQPLGIAPLRRTVVQLRTEPGPPTTLPLVLDISGRFYFKPEGARLWLSPHDEVPSEPCDAAPEELDVAVAIDRLQGVVDWRVAAVEHKWAGLRSFAPDRKPVYGFDPDCEGFFWFAGQGGFGIQTAPAAARLGAQMILGTAPDEMTETIDPARYAPGRLR